MDRRTVTDGRQGELPAVIFVTQVIDPGDPVLGFTTGLIKALAKRTSVGVIAGEVRDTSLDLGAEVLSMGRERGANRIRRGLAYESGLVKLCRHLRPAVLFAHMCPVYVTLAAPVARITRTPAMLWYAHSSDTPGLRRAERLADLVLTSLPTSFPRSGAKTHVIGQAVDIERFAFHEPVTAAGGLDLVAVGRMSLVKHYDVVLRGIALARSRGVRLTLRVLGPAASPSEQRVRADLEELIDELGLREEVSLVGAVTPSQVADALASSSALVNASPLGSADKVVFEAMACGRPVMVSNPAFRPLVGQLPLDLSFDPGDHAGLAAAIERLANAPAEKVRETGLGLSERIRRDHSLDRWADQVVALAGSLHR